ncbi:Uncharacterized protein APZ42_027775 [Daphnia magna]|uniref:DUF659 domain-containing protein n=1 Tax=Daphnia magna TaxID=35525 RepID=A0A164R385_9CRUS|nr:Uncharacterized protein APZ42_027775 [Daphnia magna]
MQANLGNFFTVKRCTLSLPTKPWPQHRLGLVQVQQKTKTLNKGDTRVAGVKSQKCFVLVQNSLFFIAKDFAKFHSNLKATFSKVAVVSLTSGHTYDKIANFLHAIILDYELNGKVQHIVTDNGYHFVILFGFFLHLPLWLLRMKTIAKKSVQMLVLKL